MAVKPAPEAILELLFFVTAKKKCEFRLNVQTWHNLQACENQGNVVQKEDDEEERYRERRRWRKG